MRQHRGRQRDDLNVLARVLSLVNRGDDYRSRVCPNGGQESASTDAQHIGIADLIRDASFGGDIEVRYVLIIGRYAHLLRSAWPHGSDRSERDRIQRTAAAW